MKHLEMHGEIYSHIHHMAKNDNNDKIWKVKN